MAKTTGPLLSLDAHGSLKKELTYSRRRSGSQCRQYNKPTGIPSAKQRGQRRLTEFLIAQWQNMSAGDKATWAANARVSGVALPAYHYFLREAQRDLYTHTGLCGYWHCNEIVAGKVLDLSGQGNHGTLKPTYPSNAPILINSYNTRLNKALLYDGVNEYVEINGIVRAVQTNIRGTIIIWIKPNTITSFHHAFAVADTNEITAVRFGQNDRKIHAAVRINGTWQWRVNTTEDFLTVGIWTEIILVQNATIPKIYINGYEKSLSWVVTTNRAAWFNNDPDFDNANIGTIYWNSSLTEHFNGAIDEVCIYNRAFSAAEIATRYKFATAKV